MSLKLFFYVVTIQVLTLSLHCTSFCYLGFYLVSANFLNQLVTARYSLLSFSKCVLSKPQWGLLENLSLACSKLRLYGGWINLSLKLMDKVLCQYSSVQAFFIIKKHICGHLAMSFVSIALWS